MIYRGRVTAPFSLEIDMDTQARRRQIFNEKAKLMRLIELLDRELCQINLGQYERWREERNFIPEFLRKRRVKG